MYSLKVVKFICEESLQNIRCNIKMEGLFIKRKKGYHFTISALKMHFMASHNAAGSYSVLILRIYIFFLRNGISTQVRSLGLVPVTSVPWIHVC
jgi:hypothetical protein